MIKTYFWVCFLIVLFGCQSTSETQHGTPFNHGDLLDDSLFSEHQNIQIETPEEIFALNDEMRQVVKDITRHENSHFSKAHQIINHIFNEDNVGLAYRSNANVIAIDAYKNKSANCLSLTIMAYSLAKEAGLDAVFRNVMVPEYWVRNGEYNMLTGHVNLLLKKSKKDPKHIVWGTDSVEVDFDPFVNKKDFPTRNISKSTVTAMFYNNKGAMAIVEQDYAKAYRYLKAAAQIAPDYHATWANLGVLYRLNNEFDYAERSYKHGIYLDGNNLNTLTNLSILLSKQNKYDESRAIDAAIIKRRIKNPYYHALLADEALYEGNAESAIRHYKRGIKVDKNVHELYFGLAKAYATVGKVQLAKAAIHKAIKLNGATSINREYVAKLDLLRANE